MWVPSVQHLAICDVASATTRAHLHTGVVVVCDGVEDLQVSMDNALVKALPHKTNFMPDCKACHPKWEPPKLEAKNMHAASAMVTAIAGYALAHPAGGNAA